MTSHPGATGRVLICPDCQDRFQDGDALRRHAIAHGATRQQREQAYADRVMALDQSTPTREEQRGPDRQQDTAGRRETAGQPSEPPVEDRNEDTRRQETQQQQHQP